MSSDKSQFPETLEQVPELTAADLMNANVPPVSPETSVAEVLRLMVEHDTAGLVVMEDDVIVGIITESDVVARQADVEAPLPVPFLDAILVMDAGRSYEEEVRRALAVNASQMMSSPVTSVRSIATLEQIASVMMDRKVNPLPIVDENNNYIGMVSRRDLVGFIALLENRLA